MGDPAGIGPEIAVKLFFLKNIFRISKPVIIGDAGVIENAVHVTRNNLKIHSIDKINDARFEFGKIDVYDLKNVSLSRLKYGQTSAMAGHAAFESVTTAIRLALEGEISATVTGPIHKKSINIAGHNFSGHTEIYAAYTHTKKYAMLLVHKNMRVIHVSTHVSLRKACDLVKKDRILDTILLLHDACLQFGIKTPKIGVAGLNPHASDGGLFGTEERDQIIPAIKAAVQRGYHVEGPVPADTLFAKAKGGLYDGCVAMYHDQGHIPFKLEGFFWDKKKQIMKSVQGVNITLGLPIIRTSVDHGTAFEIAGKGVASADALKLAVTYAVKMAAHRKSNRKVK
jgi:4-hydroxythreonine-4-phosphate dehydrogenase